jgi:hypothetical protein
MPTFPTKRASPARARLAECHAARREAEAKIAAANESMARLAGHEEAVAAVRSELTAIDIADAAAVTAWAKSGEGAAPTTDVERREAISRALSQAESQARAAATARAALSADIESAGQPLAGIQTWTTVSIAQIVCEDTAPLLADVVKLQQALAGKIEQIKQMRDFIYSVAERLPKGGEEAREVYVVGNALDADLQLAMSAREAPLDASVAARAALREFVAGLADDSTIALANEAVR